MTDTTNPQADVVERVARHLAAIDWLTTPEQWDRGSASFRADYLAHAREVIAIVQPAAVPVPASAPTDQPAALSEAEQTMLAYALDQAQERIWSEGGFTEEDQAAVTSLRRRAVLPVPADRAAILREAADIAESQRQFKPATGARWSAQISENVGILRVAEELRRLADAVPVSGPGGATDETQARPSHHRWYTETLDNAADEWAPGMRFLNRAEALERYRLISERHPLWKDGTPVERRFVRETTSYTVEPAAVAQPDGEA